MRNLRLNDATPILEFIDLTVEGGHPYDSGLWGASFSLNAGELMMVHLEHEHARVPLADAAQGLEEPSAGVVRFCGRDWRAMGEAEANEARGRIGRVFEEPGWVSELGVDENILLAARHHTRRGEAELRDEAATLAQAYSLPGLPRGRPTDVHRQDLKRAACVRAFLGEPRLVLLERPTAGVYPEIMPPLMASIRMARGRGAAVVWLTEDLDVWNDPGIRPTKRYAVSGSQLLLLE